MPASLWPAASVVGQFAKISAGLSNLLVVARLLSVRAPMAAPAAWGEFAMKYMLLIYDEPAAYEGEEGRKLMSEMIAGHMRLGEDLRNAGVVYSGSQLQPSTVATTVRPAGGAKAIHDGPFAETKEQLGGYYLIDVENLDAAIAWARRIPMRGTGGGVEVRPIVER
jgi:hypothetical protein